MDRQIMIAEIKKHKDKQGNPYQNIWVKGGLVRLEDAPTGNLFYMYKRVTGKEK